jgi:hypothetical protein
MEQAVFSALYFLPDEDNQKITAQKMFCIMFRESNIPGKGRIQEKIFNSERLETKLHKR